MRVALVGLGMVADTHAAALRDSRAVTLHGVLSRRPERTQSYARTLARTGHANPVAYSSIDAIARDSEVDFVILATPPNARAEICARLVAAGKPVLMEKPIERTWSGAKEIVKLFTDAELPLGIVLQHRAREVSQTLKQLLQKGDLGTIVSAEIRVPWWRKQSYYDEPGRGSYARDGGGVMISQAIHTLDLAIWLLGPFKHVQALMRCTPLHDLEAEDWAGALFETTQGAVGTLYATTAAYPGEAESITVHGTRAKAHLAEGTLVVTAMDGHTKTYGKASDTGAGADPMAFTHAWHQTVIEDFARCLTNQSEPLATGASALAAHAVIHAMTQASTTGQRTEVPSR